MIDQLSYTIQEMYRLAYQYRDDVKRYDLHDVYQIFKTARNIPYVTDLDSCNEDECVKRPAYGYFGGDCDDKAIFSASALINIGVPFRFVTVSFTPDGEMSHVYVEIFYNGKWQPFDPTYSSNRIFVEPDYTSKQEWNNPMTFTKQNGVATLEGTGGVGQVVEDALASIGSLQDVLGAIENILSNVPIIGGLFRGATPHVDENTAVAQQKSVGDKALVLYDALDDQGKNLMYMDAKNFFQNYIIPGWGNWWDNYINNNYAQQQVNNVFNNQRISTWHYIADPVYYFLRLDDATRVQTDLPQWYNNPIQAKVWNPVQAYIQNKYGMTAEQLEATKAASTPTTGLSLSAFGSPTTLLLIGGIALALFATRKK